MANFLDNEGLIKYHAKLVELVKSLAGVESFNGRNGIVMPQDGDYNAFMVGAVPDTRQINGKRLNADITITKDDIEGLDALTPDLSGYVPTSRKINNKALTSDITLSASDVSAVPTSRTVNGKALTTNIIITKDDIEGLDALTPDLSGYVPITGGTLTGNLYINGHNSTPLSYIGQDMAGKSVSPEDGLNETAKTGAEVFNDYRNRAFDSDGLVTRGNVATGEYSHAEGIGTTASGIASHAEGDLTIASNSDSHAEGYRTKALAMYSHVEGYRTQTTSTGHDSHAEGYNTSASGGGSHAEGWQTSANGDGSHAEGRYGMAEGNYSHSEGQSTHASGIASHAGGSNTVASADCQMAIGKFNVAYADASTKFIIGNGTNSLSKANCFRVTDAGTYADGGYNSSGADYAELFEWEDGNSSNEDRTGLFVTLDGKYIRLANSYDDFILGIVSGNPSVVGDVYDDQWQGMYLYDIYGRTIWEYAEIPDETIEVPDPEDPEKTITRIVNPAHTEHRQKLNPNYDHTQTYIPRSQRKEWACVGMMGKLVVQDDGTSKINGYVKVGENGKATASENKTSYRVMERIDEEHIRVLILANN